MQRSAKECNVSANRFPACKTTDSLVDNCLENGGSQIFSCSTVIDEWLDIRLSMKDYIAGLMEETAKTGAPIIRTMFFEFPDDEKCWELPEQYMFGSDYLVAPVLELGARERSVYLPKGQWESISDKKIYSGGQTVTVPAPLDVMPVFKKIG